jgi:hypothetical protein
MRRCQIITAAVVCVVALNGCNDCDNGETACAGDALRYCGADGAFERQIWLELSCPVTCHSAGGQAECVDSRDPVAECAGRLDRFLTCFENAETVCFDGYPSNIGQACPAPSHCVASATCGTACAIDDGPEPRCTPQQQKFCDGNDQVVCSCEFVLYRSSCGATETCLAMNDDTRCVPPETDPRCASSAQPTFGFCDGQVANECWYGYLVNSFECRPTSRCDSVTLAPQATCSD